MELSYLLLGAALVPGRTKRQCNNRWRKSLVASIAKTTARTVAWTADEDNKQKDAIQGDKTWFAVAALVPGRLKDQCCDIWNGSLKYAIDGTIGRTGPWTEDEDNKLKDAFETHGGKKCSALAALVPGRTQVQCNNRWWMAVENKRTGPWTETRGQQAEGRISNVRGQQLGCNCSASSGSNESSL
jgi:hypothetical protein